MKTLSLELDGVRCRVVDVDPSDGRAILRRKIMDELAADEDALQIGLPGDRRLTVAPRFLASEGAHASEHAGFVVGFPAHRWRARHHR